MRNFRKFEIWEQGIDLAVDAYQLVDRLPGKEEYGLKSQIKRASVSIASNIAEGCSRSSEREFKHFLEISLGSSFEVETDFIIAERLKFISTEEVVTFLNSMHKEQRQINSLISKIRRI